MSDQYEALEELLSLIGERIIELEALINLLIRKGIITDEEFDEAQDNRFLALRDKTISPAEWARRHMNQPDLLDRLFSSTSSLDEESKGVFTKELKLTIELVPKTQWFKSIRENMPSSEWDKLRKSVYTEYNHRCAICDGGGRMNCHEVWEYDDQNHIQKLTGFVALCNLCHHVKHIGLASKLAQQGKLNFDSIINHFMNVNNCNIETFVQHKNAALRKWKARSRHEWNIDFGDYQSLMKRIQ